jgi:hypothetical protein
MRPTTWTTTHGDTVEVYGRWWNELDIVAGTSKRVERFRYRVQARNGEIVEQGSEAYTTAAAAIEAAQRHHPRLDPLTAEEVAALEETLSGVRAAMLVQAEAALRSDGGES